MKLAKEAASSPIGSRHPDGEVAEFELELLNLIVPRNWSDGSRGLLWNIGRPRGICSDSHVRTAGIV